MTAEQPDLFDPVDKSKTSDDSTLLYRALKMKGWLSATQLAGMLGWTDRKVRKAASESAGMIVSAPGKEGYCRIDEVTTVEMAETDARMIRGSATVLVHDLWILRLLVIRDPLELCGMSCVKPDDLEDFMLESGELESIFEAWPEDDK